jgi:hypothetical protein
MHDKFHLICPADEARIYVRKGMLVVDFTATRPQNELHENIELQIREGRLEVHAERQLWIHQEDWTQGNGLPSYIEEEALHPDMEQHRYQHQETKKVGYWWKRHEVVTREYACYWTPWLRFNRNKRVQYLSNQFTVILSEHILNRETVADDSVRASSDTLLQVGWLSKFGIVPGGMDVSPSSQWTPIYVRQAQ